MTQTLIDIFEERVNSSGPDVALRGASMVAGVSWREWFDISERIAAGLMTWGVQRGDRVALVSQTRPEWAFVDIAIMMCGAISVPFYASSPADSFESMLRDSKPVAVFVEDPVQLQKILEASANLDSLSRAVFFDSEVVFRQPGPDGKRQLDVKDVPLGRLDVKSFSDLEGEGRRAIVDNPKLVSRQRRAIGPEDIASIVYTSGTSREPLGVMLTHDNFVAEITAINAMGILRPTDAQLLFLPLAHIFARVLYLTAIGYGIETTMVSELHRLKEYWQTFRPTFFAAVPHVLEKIQEQILADVEKHDWTSSVFKIRNDVKKWSKNSVIGPAVRLVSTHIVEPVIHAQARENFGGRIRFLISGGAPLPIRVGAFFGDLGIQVLEGYGLTEVTAVATVNVPDEYRLGSVGRPLPGVEVAIDEDGEILIRGRSVMRGYRNRHAETEACLGPDGWFRSGDLGEYDRDGFLHITGRKKDLIVTSGGKNIAPSPLEEALRNHPLVDSAIVFGDERPYLVGLFALATEPVRKWLAGAPGSDEEGRLLLFEEIAKHVQEVNSKVASFEAIRKFDFLTSPFVIDEEVTPTNKIRRRRIFEKYRNKIDAMYLPDDPPRSSARE
jgi:long-chain acyl-CoA synthetase